MVKLSIQSPPKKCENFISLKKKKGKKNKKQAKKGEEDVKIEFYCDIMVTTYRGIYSREDKAAKTSKEMESISKFEKCAFVSLFIYSKLPRLTPSSSTSYASKFQNSL